MVALFQPQYIYVYISANVLFPQTGDDSPTIVEHSIRIVAFFFRVGALFGLKRIFGGGL